MKNVLQTAFLSLPTAIRNFLNFLPFLFIFIKIRGWRCLRIFRRCFPLAAGFINQFHETWILIGQPSCFQLAILHIGFNNFSYKILYNMYLDHYIVGNCLKIVFNFIFYKFTVKTLYLLNLKLVFFPINIWRAAAEQANEKAPFIIHQRRNYSMVRRPSQRGHLEDF